MVTAIVDAWRWLLTLLTEFFTGLICTILSSGPMPRHIGFVMDGNRRFARTHHKRVLEGHTQGFHALHRLLDTCLRLGISCVSVYAFSIENFKRSQDEVDDLMGLAKEKLIEMSQKGAILERHQIRVNIIGRRDLLPLDVQNVAQKVEAMTQHHSKAILNICMPYLSRDEIAEAVEVTVSDCQAGYLRVGDIDEAEIEKHLQTVKCNSPPLDVLVRTSGTYRLSDYLLWQSCETAQIHFCATYWPDFGLWDFIPILFAFQRRAWASAL